MTTGIDEKPKKKSDKGKDYSEMSHKEMVEIINAQNEQLEFSEVKIDELNKKLEKLESQVDDLGSEIRGKESSEGTAKGGSAGPDLKEEASETTPEKAETPSQETESEKLESAPDNINDFIKESGAFINEGNLGEGELHDILARVSELSGFEMDAKQKESLDSLKKKAYKELQNVVPELRDGEPIEFEDRMREGTGREDIFLGDRRPGEKGYEEAQEKNEFEGMSDEEIERSINALIDMDNKETDRNNPEAMKRRQRIFDLMSERDRRDQGESSDKNASEAAVAEVGAVEIPQEMRDEVPSIQSEMREGTSYKELEEARKDYLERLAKRRRWFFRGDESEFELARERYEQAQEVYIAEMAAEMKRKGYTNEQILEAVPQESIEELLIRTQQEVEIAENGKFRKIKNWIKRHPGIRMMTGIALSGGAFVTGMMGMLPLSVGLVAARAAFVGASATITAEGAFETFLGKRARGINKELSPEDLEKRREDSLNEIGVVSYKDNPQRAEELAEEVLATNLNEELGKRLAYSVSMGQGIEENETVMYILAEKKRILRERLARELGEDKSPDEIRASMLSESISEDVMALESAQMDERKLGIKKWVASGVIGLIVGGITAKLGLDNIRAREAAEAASASNSLEAQPLSTEPIQEMAPPPPTYEMVENGFSQELTVPNEMGEWTLADMGFENYKNYMLNHGYPIPNLTYQQKDQVLFDLMNKAISEPNHPNFGGEHFLNPGFTRLFTGPNVQNSIDRVLAGQV